MRFFKNIALSAMLTIGAFSAVTYTACNKDECEDVVCNNGGTCVSGACSCPSGYEGNQCETESRGRFIKTWTAQDVRTADNFVVPAYSAIIVRGTTDVTQIRISNFSDLFVNQVVATVNGSTVTITEQEPDNDNYTVSGTGTYNDATGTISWSYTLRDPQGNTQAYTGVWN